MKNNKNDNKHSLSVILCTFGALINFILTKNYGNGSETKRVEKWSLDMNLGRLAPDPKLSSTWLINE